jgi:sodium/hydrogen exchanger-like protein 6/7/sodium/hydrogen exchanger 8
MNNNLNITNILRNLIEENPINQNQPVKAPSSSNLSYKGVVAIIILIFYTIAEPIFKKLNFHYLHESGICMIVGMIIALISKYVGNISDSLNNFVTFDDEMFFNIVLPPIIFSAGYNLKKRAFFKYFFYIIAFGIFGTLISFGTVSTLIHYSNKWNFFTPFKLDNKLILLFASVIASTDTVAAMTFIKEDQMPKLFSVLFGEGVLNDAVCIVLYRILSKFDFEHSAFNVWTILSIVGSFLMMFFFSCFIGVGNGLLCSFLLKILKSVHLSRVQETSLIIFFAFLTYLVTELMHFSPIISLLFCGIFMSHYAFYNLSFQAREESSIVSKILSNIAEGFVFTYLGLTSISISHDSFSFVFLLLVFIYVLIGRFLAVYGISFILNFFKLKIFQFDVSERGITFFAGCIRGAIAFGLAISMPAENDDSIRNKQMLISSTLILVFITTVLFGALMSPIVKFFTKGKNISRRNNQENNFNGEELKNYSLQGFDGETLTIGDIESFLNKPRNHINKIQGLWQKIDEKILKPIFIDNYNTAREEHAQIAKEIMQLFENHEKKKLKQKAINSFNKKNGLDEDTNGVEMKESEPGNDSSTNLTNLTNFKPIEINNSSLSSK